MPNNRLKQQMVSMGHAAWRVLPRDLRRDGAVRIAAALARRPDTAPPTASNGVIIAGDTSLTNGLSESARIMHEAIAAKGLARGFIPLGLPIAVPSNRAPVPADAALLAVVNAPVLPFGLLRLKRDFIAGRRVIGLWAWELPVAPKSWAEGAKFVHEVWAPSRFTADALAPLAPGRVRVVPFPLAEIDLPVAGDRASFGLPKDALVVLTVINLASSMVRKNPLGNIAAFKAAFGARRDCIFVLKLSGTADYPADLALIRAAIDDAPNIRLMSESIPQAQLHGLMAAADIVLSLHRAEGFGLVPATAMLLGRAVVATNWSGNVTFMNAESSALIDYRLIPATDPRGTYQFPQARWADPEIEDAASRLLELADPERRAAMALAGQTHARRVLDGAALRAALRENGIA